MTFIRSSIYCMRWEEILISKTLVRSILPAMFKNIIFQSANLFFMLSIKNWKSLLVGLLWNVENPRYLPNVSLGDTLRRLEHFSVFSIIQFIEKITLDLPKLIFWPERALKLFRASLIVTQFLISTLELSHSQRTYKRFWD